MIRLITTVSSASSSEIFSVCQKSPLWITQL